MTKLTLSLVAALATLAVAPPAHAASFGEWLAFCAGGDDMIDAKIKADSLKTCGLDEGVKSACSVLQGTPWTCSTPAAMPKAMMEQCDQFMVKFSLGAGLAMPVGWKVEGKAQASFTRFATKTNVNVCNTSPVIPTPHGEGGGYSAESGDIAFMARMSIMGEVTVRSPVGLEVTLNAEAGCNRTTNGHFYKKAEVNSCGSPTPTPTASPTASPTTPTPTGSPPTTPTPGGTPPATPPPTTPTPGGTPPATPPPTTPTPGGTPPPTPPPTTPTPGSTPPATPMPTTPTPSATAQPGS